MIKKFLLTLSVLLTTFSAFADNYILYTSSESKVVTPFKTDAFGANIVSNTYEAGQGKILFDGEVTKIGKDAFFYCETLKTIEIPNSVTSIGNGAFGACHSLTTTNIPDGITSIEDYTFQDCTNLTSLVLPSSVTKIGTQAFVACTSLTSINIPNSVKIISEQAFAGCTNLTSVEIGNSVTSIGNAAFGGCSMTSIVIPNSVEIIGNSAFESCTKLTSVVIPNSVTTLGSSVFAYCIGLSSVEIGNSVASISANAFLGCLHIKTFSGKFASSDNRALIDNDGVMIAFARGAGLTSYTIPSSVTSIGASMFSGCTDLTSIIIPDGVKTIGGSTFKDCSSLTSLTLPSTVTAIGGSAFEGCTNLASVNIPDGVASIGGSTFKGCSSLTSLTLPSTAAIYGNSVFEGCTNLASVNVPDGTTSIGSSTFKDCSSLTSLTLPSTVTSIGGSAFEGCTNLASVNIPNGVPSIDSYTFRNCSSLKSIEFPYSVTEIGYYALQGCTSLKEFKFNYLCCTIPYNNLSDIPSDCLIKVPVAYYEDYYVGYFWKFSNIELFADLYDYTDEDDFSYSDYFMDYDDCDVTYTRDFTNTEWQGLCLPFAMNYSDWSSYGTIAELTGASEGNLEWTVLGAGSLTEAGKPYIFKPKTTGEVTFSVKSATLVADETYSPVTINGYTLSGTYTKKNDMGSIRAYALAGGVFRKAEDDSWDKVLKPFRIYLTVPTPSTAPICNTIIGEGGTVIEELTIDALTIDNCYNLNGQKVGAGYKGIVIENGRKVIRR